MRVQSISEYDSFLTPHAWTPLTECLSMRLSLRWPSIRVRDGHAASCDRLCDRAGVTRCVGGTKVVEMCWALTADTIDWYSSTHEARFFLIKNRSSKTSLRYTALTKVTRDDNFHE